MCYKKRFLGKACDVQQLCGDIARDKVLRSRNTAKRDNLVEHKQEETRRLLKKGYGDRKRLRILEDYSSLI